ncbi:unnamed protein product [Rotaria sordida]|uniref:Uncharacterized protein n=1 Tax=Rotaria sordida TaxID=392033 RepID=A0A815ZQZ4_9BILA|nr:unnamed protein product [Rotaria sordida]CAF1586444.1 unnamed protein product [Rotaria sordida]
MWNQNNKKSKPDQESPKEQLASSGPLLSSNIENKGVKIVQNNLGDFKKMMKKVAPDTNRKPNLSPPTEPLVSANESILQWQVFFSDPARIVLTDAEFTRGYSPDFRGNTENRVLIPQESIDLLQNMGSIWVSVRTSLVQKVTDIHKSEKRKSQKQEQNKQPQQDPISLSEDNHDLVSVATNNQT